MSKGISRKLKDQVWKRDRGICFYCKRYLSREDPERTLDHVIPKSKGGANRMWNLVTACRPCNSAKEDHDPAEEHLAIIYRRRELSQLYVTIGRAIGAARLRGDDLDAQILIELQNKIYYAIYKGYDLAA